MFSNSKMSMIPFFHTNKQLNLLIVKQWTFVLPQNRKNFDSKLKDDTKKKNKGKK